MSRRDDILSNIKQRMQLISEANGYHADISDVSVWRVTPYANNDLPAINIRDLQETEVSEERKGGVTKHQMTVEIEATCAGNTTASDLRMLIADIENAIRQDERWSGLAIKTLPKKNEFVIAQDKQKIGGVLVNVVVEYLTLRFQEN